MARELTKDDVSYAVTGGSLLGGGGGGWPDDGRAIGNLAIEIGNPRLASLDEFDDDDLLVTVAMVGAPAAKDKYVKPVHYVRALEMLQDRLKKPVAGIMTNENGPGTTVNGWLQSAMLGVPIVDAPCNGRAHPTGVMGSIGLHQQPGYTSIQAAAGGFGERQLETVVAGSITAASASIRDLSVRAGGLVAVARNPVSVKYAREHCAVGGISQTIDLGKRMVHAQAAGGAAVIEAALNYLGGQIIYEGVVGDVYLETKGGFDVGKVTVGDVELTFWNEYMTLERSGERLATFPDLVMTLDAQTGKPIITAEIHPGQLVVVVSVPKDRLKLGAGMRDPELFRPVEETVGKPVIRYVFSGAVNV
ncbi:DUF917 domain-containing protein [Alicyclobacillus dauci]|uniref:DUF917 family protein n=1 Tax=Alicyclobacillus dauci TaxID=1475485 RepID=A0ABY6Z457_9BACL|nr:DUF917 family protein [Alicyclobacillus dauci]WAH37101.1 DUF917 family protein [Alicyclobacillus dauci]